jgi:alkylation response protein AidB-like acyl-CoA dehydrogenase
MILSDEQRSLRDAARRYARERLLPAYRQRELAGMLDRALLPRKHRSTKPGRMPRSAKRSAGHYGWSKDLPHQQRLRDVMGLEIGDGTAGVMKLVIARERIGRAAVQY